LIPTTVPTPLTPTASPTAVPFDFHISQIIDETNYNLFDDAGDFNFFYEFRQGTPEFSILKEDCKTASDINVNVTGPLSVIGTEHTKYSFPALDPLVVLSSSMWNDTSNTAGEFKFCALLMLSTAGYKINFYETIYTLTVNKTVGFNIVDVEVKRTVPSTEEKQLDYNVVAEAYQCENDGSAITDPESLVKYNGDVLTICVKLDDSDFEVTNIESLRVNQITGIEGDDGESLDYVIDGIPNVLARTNSLNIDGVEVVQARLQLIVAFFPPENILPLEVSGKVAFNLQTSRRILGSQNWPTTRMLEDGKPTTEGSFDLIVDVGGEDTSAAGSFRLYVWAFVACSALSILV